MSSQVVRVQGFNKGSLSAIGKEVEREQIQHRNPDIDIKRTHLNEIYKQTKNGMYAEWKDVCSNLNVSNVDKLKKKAIAFEGMVITSDKDFFEKLGYRSGLPPPEKIKKFFTLAYTFAIQEIGFKGTDTNVLSAVVHYDETTPHLQLYYVPVVDTWKEKVLQRDKDGKVLKSDSGSPIQARDDSGKLIWKVIRDSGDRKLSRDSFWKNKGGNTSYTKLQDRFHEQIGKAYNLGRGEKGSTREHTTKAQWEIEKIEALKSEKHDLERQIPISSSTVLGVHEIAKIEPKQGFGCIKNVTLKEIEHLKAEATEKIVIERAFALQKFENESLLKKQLNYQQNETNHTKIKKEATLLKKQIAHTERIINSTPELKKMFDTALEEDMKNKQDWLSKLNPGNQRTINKKL
ncbi:hypothetical protein Ami103574_04215 [Aminipila butyrica]|uniref:Plasmid recombination enzyme n=1 Tax=Aminipila butyrica TaxID=433296 RepID=A0A858BU14_9FIRM|nr:MobV family relaxase [Aminipila butyrica]QIB68575.1 hypothetical protein Ami103574_04215 [Aminipila butyrica]